MRPPHDLVTWSGTIGDPAAPNEQWSCGLRLEPSLTATIAQMQANVDDLWFYWQSLIMPHLAQQVRLTECTHASITALGKYAVDGNGAYYRVTHTETAAGSSVSGSQLPLQSATAVSLTTPRAGATGRGRIFLPTVKETLDADGRHNIARVQTLRDQVRQLILAINGNTQVGNVVVSSSKGYETLVTGVRCGRVVDTLRSRRASQVEEYQSAAL